MPTSYIKKLSKQGKGSVPALEKKWDKAKDAAAKHGHKDNYGYITEIFKNMAHANLEVGASLRLDASTITTKMLRAKLSSLENAFSAMESVKNNPSAMKNYYRMEGVIEALRAVLSNNSFNLTLL